MFEWRSWLLFTTRCRCRWIKEATFFFFFWCSAVYSRSMTPITGQAAVDSDEQDEQDAARHPQSSRRWPAAGGRWRRRTAATAARHLQSSRRWGSCLGKIAEVVSRCFPRGFYFRISFFWVVGCSSIINTSMQGSCQRQPCCHRAVMVVQERCCAFEHAIEASKEAIYIRKEQDKSVNRDKGSYQLSHAAATSGGERRSTTLSVSRVADCQRRQLSIVFWLNYSWNWTTQRMLIGWDGVCECAHARVCVCGVYCGYRAVAASRLMEF